MGASNPCSVTTLFVDIGGVLLTDGWDHHARRRAARKFELDFDEMETRHHLIFGIYEEGKLTLKEYLSQAVFFRKRPFSHEEFWTFMSAQSESYPEMINLIGTLKSRYDLKIVVVSNEARELNSFRIEKFKLNALVDCFISSCFVHCRKPDAEIFRLALDIAQVAPAEVVFIENTPMFVETAKGLGIRSILHTVCETTRVELASFGLTLPATVEEKS